LKEIGSITENENSLYIKEAFNGLSAGKTEDSTIVNALVTAIFGAENVYQSAFLEYLRRFKVSAGNISYKPMADERHRHSTVRNFLMELGIIIYSSQSDEYLLNADRFDLFLTASGSAKAISPSKLKVRLRGREDIGFAAENVIFQWEKQRVGSHLASNVDHVALRNASAGFDIKSFTEVSVGNHVPRYIEVKAVPPATMRFFWTANERKIAKLLEDVYFLYLLPVLCKGTFDLNGLQIIPNPFLQVYQKQDKWLVEEDVVSCRLR